MCCSLSQEGMAVKECVVAFQTNARPRRGSRQGTPAEENFNVWHGGGSNSAACPRLSVQMRLSGLDWLSRRARASGQQAEPVHLACVQAVHGLRRGKCMLFRFIVCPYKNKQHVARGFSSVQAAHARLDSRDGCSPQAGKPTVRRSFRTSAATPRKGAADRPDVRQRLLSWHSSLLSYKLQGVPVFPHNRKPTAAPHLHHEQLRGCGLLNEALHRVPALAALPPHILRHRAGRGAGV